MHSRWSAGQLRAWTRGHNHRVTSQLANLPMRSLALAVLSALVVPSAALAQREIPKAQGNDMCPMGYVNTLGTTCVSPIYYEVAPTYGEACLSGWMNIGAGYCRKKRGPLGIFWEPLKLIIKTLQVIARTINRLNNLNSNSLLFK